MDKSLVISHFSPVQKDRVLLEVSKQTRSKRQQKLNAKLEIKRNSASLQRLKYNYCYSDEQQFQFNDENLQSSYDTMTQNSNDEQDENIQSQVYDQLQEKDSHVKRSIKAQERDKLDKSIMSFLDKQNQSYYDEADQQINQESQFQGYHSNLIYEQQDAHKIVRKSFSSSQAKLKSFEGLESIEFNNQESLKNILHKEKSQQETNNIIQTKEIESVQIKKLEQQQQYAHNQSDKEGSNYNNSRILDKQRILQQNQTPSTYQLGDQQKNQFRKGSYSNKQFIKQISNQSEEELDSSCNQDDSQYQKSYIQESNKKASTSNHITTYSKINSLKKSQKYLNQNYEERNSIDCAFQNIATFLYLQGMNVSSKQLNSGNHFYQDNPANNSFTSKRNKCQKESRSSFATQKKNKSFSSTNNPYESSQEKYKTEKLSKIFKQQPSQKDLQFINTLTKVLQNSQIPLLLQLASAKSFLNLDSQFQNSSMDYFDKIQCFKKYYPENNIQNVILKLKVLQQQQKKLKKAKLALRERRQNIRISKFSQFQQNSKVIKIVPKQDYNINQYKPTNLSYGVKMQNGTIYPKFSFSQQNN
ncbi:cyclic nucleotide-binding domain protein (macronuclear) [Tetrahymena thermophila SB210]|uniref:Cyclic nucleotide-binding domain protein n=1 Tax=Tetrahymena thermophila (strain SB210) TaxID=312017 RepID=Q22A59_TETTS|nr:cyclic nucleotide-binding domain protein [Tetrahymena thermophila SB210]EAR82173.2 cyclic nucleotide-binding domain protein [Tetrahymena thermophila SB210]|eukprot:XP_001029836.2 cyclic nucleotide-binding domain protein [Tetrahymena thermophila SB210]